MPAKHLGLTFEALQVEMKREMEDLLAILNSVDDKSKLTCINDHTKKEEVVVGVITLDNNNICRILEDTDAYSLNPLYLSKRDGKIHSAKVSVGGVIVNKGYSTSEEAIVSHKAMWDSNNVSTKIVSYEFWN